MNLKSIADRVAARYGMNKALSMEICRGFTRELGNELAQGNSIVLPEFGTFKTTVRVAAKDKRTFGYTHHDKFYYKFIPATKLRQRGIDYLEINGEKE